MARSPPCSARIARNHIRPAGEVARPVKRNLRNANISQLAVPKDDEA